MIEQYFPAEGKKIGYFFGLLIGAALVVTLLYWLVFGFDRWSGQMQRAADMMTVAATAPTVQPHTPTPSSTAGQYVCPQDGGVGLPDFDAAGAPHCPVCGRVMTFSSVQAGGLSPAAAPG